jgi:death-on-curing protein
MIDSKEVLTIHEILIEKFGGSKGVRDINVLLSALNRPFATFDGEELHKTINEKAAALIESLVKNHAFIDGNKRTGYVIMRLFMMQNGFDINASYTEKYDFVIDIASGKSEIHEIVNWIKEHQVKL